MFVHSALMKQDARMNPDFWVVKRILVQHFGAKLPCTPLCAFMRAVRNEQHLSLPREATRMKDLGISWLCQNWDKAEPMLSQIGPTIEGESSKECEKLPELWPLMCEIEAKLRAQTGQKPSMKELLTPAKKLAASHGLRLPRDARRNRKFLLAWYAQHWNVLETEVMTRLIVKPSPVPQPPKPVPIIVPDPILVADVEPIPVVIDAVPDSIWVSDPVPDPFWGSDVELPGNWTFPFPWDPLW